MVLSNRKALSLYLFKIHRAKDIHEIMTLSHDLDNYKGDRVPLEVVTKEINSVAEALQEDYLGLKVINFIDVTYLPLYKGIKLCINPLVNAKVQIPLIVICRLVARYFGIITESIQVSFIEEKYSLRLVFNPSMPKQVSRHQIDGVMLAVHKILYALSGLTPIKLTIAHRHSSHGIDLYKKLFGISAELSDETNSLYYALDPIDSHKSSSVYLDSVRKRLRNCFFIGPLQNMMNKEFPNLSYSERCEHILMTIMGLNETNREQVALVLNMSVSSLQRRLREEGTSFHRILLETKKIMAHKYLIEQRLPATDVAFLLGYHSHSQFFQAFKLWYLMTPMAYQKQHQGQP